MASPRFVVERPPAVTFQIVQCQEVRNFETAFDVKQQIIGSMDR